MSAAHQIDEPFERYRDYLRLLARTGLKPRLQAKIDPSDIVQETLIEACRARNEGKYEFQGSRQELAWLRRILANRLAKAGRDHGREQRDLDREQSIDAELERSSLRLENLLVAEGSTPSEKVLREERTLLLAGILASLPESQRDALILQQWHGWTFEEIAARLGTSRHSAGRLVRGALETLRHKLAELR